MSNSNQPPIPPSDHLPPEGIPTVTNQGQSGTCVRFAIAKAVANFLFLRKKFDVDENQIMNALVQEKRKICAINPKEYNNTTLFLQDQENAYEQRKAKNKSWWEVIFSNINIAGRGTFPYLIIIR